MPSTMSEKDVAHLARLMIADKEFCGLCRTLEWRDEVVIQLPDMGTVSIDNVFCIGGEFYGAVESKKDCNAYLEMQITRAREYCNVVFGAYIQPSAIHEGFKARTAKLDRAGAGRIAIVDGIASWRNDPTWRDVDTTRIAKAFAEAPETGPAAGSAAALRNTPARNFWLDMIACLSDGLQKTWTQIQEDCPEYAATTCHAVCKAIKRKECLGVKTVKKVGKTYFALEAKP